MNTVFIANRGEIAARIARTCERLGIRAVVSTGDYLDTDAQVSQALAAGAQAVHPGYGFLSENAAFARAVMAAGLVWVGPPPEAMAAMARKDKAREIAVAAGVPVVPEYRWSSSERSERVETASFPVLVKAAAGGGGKGMRVVRSAAELDEAKAAAAREAASAFGDDTLLIEKYVERGRHIEVQVFGDTHGNVIHFGTRDCSAQRRHQKVVEEAPAPTLSDEQRALVQDSAVALAKQVGYTNAGTVEFLLDDDTGEAYFLEMNTRLQVEHPVTEEITGLDLVELQLRVAAGEPLGVDQEEVAFTGHAIEVRIYAEDPYAGFLPQAGTATLVAWPAGVRVDHALVSGQVVSTAFDPMLGKVVVHAEDRETARRALVEALDRTGILGITTNTGFLRQLVASEEFRDAAIDTAWLDRNPPQPPDPTEARELAARIWYDAHATTTGPFASDGFRLGGPAADPVVQLDVPVTLGRHALRSPGRPPRTTSRLTRAGIELAHHGQRWVFHRPDPFDRTHAAGAEGTVTSPMPGTVLDVRVAEGDAVEEGQVLGVVEAMKMELALKAPYAGTVTHVGVRAGQQVTLGAELFLVEAVEAATDE
ncbi:MAG TPA: biotin carboxylase N-terminal domain-containing protein [Nocardioides sp.]|uniref:acetyl/propionyl/methylcrotonyl-CoA carboxylase subunit alpha n=1 Tax=Nocardioides sp. TaxID=35761 RepID=UPI002ED829AB